MAGQPCHIIVTTQRVDDVTTLELVRLVDRLQRENRDLAGLVGSLQERNANLEAQLAYRRHLAYR